MFRSNIWKPPPASRLKLAQHGDPVAKLFPSLGHQNLRTENDLQPHTIFSAPQGIPLLKAMAPKVISKTSQKIVLEHQQGIAHISW